MSCKKCHPTPNTKGVLRQSVLKANAVSSIVIQLAKKAFVSQLLLPLLSIKPTICRFCMQDIHYPAFKGIPTGQKWICKISTSIWVEFQILCRKTASNQLISISSQFVYWRTSFTCSGFSSLHFVLSLFWANFSVFIETFFWVSGSIGRILLIKT